MSEQTIGAIISGLVGLSAVLISKTDIFNRDHSRILKSLELYNLLPKVSNTKEKLLLKIDSDVHAMIKKEATLTRSLGGVILALSFLASGVYLTWFFIDKGSWWSFGLILSVSMVVLGLVGFSQDISRLERDDKGNPVKK